MEVVPGHPRSIYAPVDAAGETVIRVTTSGGRTLGCKLTLVDASAARTTKRRSARSVTTSADVTPDINEPPPRISVPTTRPTIHPTPMAAGAHNEARATACLAPGSLRIC
jgi:hypothetical protein